MREVVEATLRAFGVDRTKIHSAAERQLEALEAFVRFSHEQSQQVIDANAQRIADLQAEIERCRQASTQSTAESEERARTVNEVLLKVQRVLDFFGDERRAVANGELDEVTMVSGLTSGGQANGLKPPPTPGASTP
jgi:hypothetical protein